MNSQLRSATTGDQNASDTNSIGTNAMKIQATPTSASSTVAIDLKALRLSPNYGATLGVKKHQTTVPVGRPKKPVFFRAHLSDDMTFPVMFLENKEARESHIVMPDIAQQITEMLRPVMLHAAIDRQNNVFLIPIPLPGESGLRNPWHESLAQAVEQSKLKWLRISANMHIGGYDVYQAEAALPEPEWPDYDIETLIRVAFRGKIITALDHPVVQSLLGRI